MNAQTKKRLLLVGGVVALGGVAYYLWGRSQEAAAAPTPLPSGGGGGGTLPKPQPLPQPQAKQPSQSLLAAIESYNAVKASMADMGTVPRLATQVELDAMRVRILTQAKIEGVSVNV